MKAIFLYIVDLHAVSNFQISYGVTLVSPYSIYFSFLLPFITFVSIFDHLFTISAQENMSVYV